MEESAIAQEDNARNIVKVRSFPKNNLKIDIRSPYWFKRKLIFKVRNHKVLYNPNHPNFSDIETKNTAWAAVAASLNTNVDHCQTTWADLRFAYQRYVRKLRKFLSWRNTKIQLRPVMAYEIEMSFLWPYILSKADFRKVRCKQKPPTNDVVIIEDEEDEPIVIDDEPIEILEDDEPSTVTKTNRQGYVNKFTGIVLNNNIKQLIEHIKSYPELYDATHKYYMDFRRRGIIWNSIANEMKEKATKCIKLWILFQTRYEYQISQLTEARRRSVSDENSKELEKVLEFLKPHILKNPATVYKQSCSLKIEWFEPIEHFKNIFNLLTLLKKFPDIPTYYEKLVSAGCNTANFMPTWIEISHKTHDCPPGSCEVTWLLFRLFYMELTAIRKGGYQLQDKWFFESIITDLYTKTPIINTSQRQNANKKTDKNNAQRIEIVSGKLIRISNDVFTQIIHVSPDSANATEKSPAIDKNSSNDFNTPTSSNSTSTSIHSSNNQQTHTQIINITTSQLDYLPKPVNKSPNRLSTTLAQNYANNVAHVSCENNLPQFVVMKTPLVGARKPGKRVPNISSKSATIKNTIALPEIMQTITKVPISAETMNVFSITPITPPVAPSAIPQISSVTTIATEIRNSPIIIEHDSPIPQLPPPIPEPPNELSPVTITTITTNPPSPTEEQSLSPTLSANSSSSPLSFITIRPEVNNTSNTMMVVDSEQPTTSDNSKTPNPNTNDSAKMTLNSNEIMVELVARNGNKILVVHGPPLSEKYVLTMAQTSDFIREIMAIPVLHQKSGITLNFNHYWQKISFNFNLPICVTKACWNFLKENFTHFHQIAPMDELMAPFSSDIFFWKTSSILFDHFIKTAGKNDWRRHRLCMPAIINEITLHPVLYADVKIGDVEERTAENEEIYEMIYKKHSNLINLKVMKNLWLKLKEVFVCYMMDIERGIVNEWPVDWFFVLAKMKFLYEHRYSNNEPFYYIVRNKIREEIDRYWKRDTKTNGSSKNKNENIAKVTKAETKEITKTKRPTITVAEVARSLQTPSPSSHSQKPPPPTSLTPTPSSAPPPPPPAPLPAPILPVSLPRTVSESTSQSPETVSSSSAQSISEKMPNGDSENDDHSIFKNSFKMLDQYRLSKKLRNYPEIYDRSKSSIAQKEIAWKNLAKDMGLSVIKCRQMFEQTLISYRFFVRRDRFEKCRLNAKYWQHMQHIFEAKSVLNIRTPSEINRMRRTADAFEPDISMIDDGIEKSFENYVSAIQRLSDDGQYSAIWKIRNLFDKFKSKKV